MELTEGLWTNKKLAQWFQITEGSFKNSKEKKLEELYEYADFELINGKVMITKVYEPYYSKKGSSNYEAIKENFGKIWKPGELNTCSRVSGELMAILDLDISEGYAEKLTRDVRTELYGNPGKNNNGSLGSCMYKWCKQGENGVLVKFTEEEEKIKKEMMSKYWGDTTEKTILVNALVESGRIRKEDAWEVYNEMIDLNQKTFYEFLQELSFEIGAVVVKGTILSDKPKNAFLIDD